MNDVTEIAEMAHDACALAVGDGVSFAPHRLPDVKRLGLDLYLFGTYKTFGTHIGVMWGKKEILGGLKDQGHFFNADKPHYRLTPAGSLHAEIAALAGLGAYYNALYEHPFTQKGLNRHERSCRVFDLFAVHEARLTNRLLESLRELPGMRIIGQNHAEPGRRASTISVVPEKKMPSDVVKQLVERKIAVRNGYFYAFRCVEALGVKDPEKEGVIRISLVHYNHEDEVDRLIETLSEV